MRVVYDSQIFAAQHFGGISRYFVSLAREMSLHGDIDPLIVAPLHVNEYLDGLPPGAVIGQRVGHSKLARWCARIASTASDGLLQCRLKPDIVHETYYYPQPRWPSQARTVITVHDMIYEKLPQYFSRRDPVARWKAGAISRADHIICVSQHTRDDLLQMTDLDLSQVSVTHLGCDSLAPLLPRESPAAFRTLLLGSDAPYLLYVGSRAAHKNFHGLLRAYSSSCWLRENFLLLCFGGGAFTALEQSTIAEFGLVEKVRQVGGSDAVLAGCYANAAVLAYPSLYEGFGIPPLEAMSLDCPVACSNTSSIPEVVGDAAASFDPSDPDAIRATLEGLLGSSELRRVLVERGRRRVENFSWKRCAQQTVDVYRKVLA